MMDIRLALMTGVDIPIPECQLVIHQPTIREISYIGEQDFFIGAQTICLNKDMIVEGKTLLENTTNFQIFMAIMNDKEMAEKKFSVQQVISLLFPQYKALFTPRSLIFKKETETFTIDEQNFEFLQQMIIEVCGLKMGSGDQKNYNIDPNNAKAKEIMNKIMNGRKRVAAQKQDGNSSIFGQYISSLAIGLRYPLQFLLDSTIYQLYDLLERFQLYTAWDLDVRSRMAGAKPIKEIENWMKGIH